MKTFSFYRKTFFLFFLACTFPVPLFAGTLTPLRDTIGTSAPSLPATHEVQFTVENAIPPGGKIVITPDAGAFIIPAGLNFLDADLSVATSTVYTDRPLAGSPSATDDGLSVVSGVSGSLTFTLNSIAGINAGEKVQIELGNNATFSATGTNFIINPTPIQSYRIRIQTTDASNAQIDLGTTMIAIVAQVTAGPVNTTIGNPPIISNGLPSGLLPSGTIAVDLSVQTDLPAICKYSAIPDIPFASSTGAFISTGGTVHSNALITGLTNGSAYSYYVRCRNYQLLANTTDYIISFSIGIVAGPPLPPPPPPAPSRSGPPGGGDFLKAADVVISGKAYPSAKVSILKDGKDAASVTASSDGTWSAKLIGLERGTYTFGAYALDAKNKKSATISSTVSLIAGTTNTVTRIFLPPTIGAEKTSVEPGESFVFSGFGIQNSITEITLRGQGTNTAFDPRVATTTVSANGTWNATIDTKGLSVGGYEARTRSLLSGGDSSGFGSSLSLGLGQDAAPDLAARSDLNKDGKVNLVDFSILLFSWGTNDAVADINQNGKVDLADFSILIFYWTG